MKHDFNWKALKEKEVTISYNMGLEMAVFVLEMAEGLSPEGRKHLLDLLKKNISKVDGSYTPRLTEYIAGNNANPMSIDEICEYLNINQDTFLKLIEIMARNRQMNKE